MQGFSARAAVDTCAATTPPNLKWQTLNEETLNEKRSVKEEEIRMLYVLVVGWHK